MSDTAPMRLWYAPNTIAAAVAIALEEAGLPYDPVRVDFAGGEQRGEAFHKLNPKGRVPVLAVDGELLTETGAILDFIAARAPEAGLLPEDPFAAARMRALMYYLASTAHVNHAHGRRGDRWASLQSSFDDMAAKVPETMTECAAYIDAFCITGPFVLGDRLSLADCYLHVVLNWLEGDGVDVAPFARIRAFRETMEARPSVRAVRQKGILK